MRIQGLKKVLAKIRAKIKNYPRTSCVVGYTAAYGIYVHEAIERKLLGLPRPKGRGHYWDPQGRAIAKFLEGPARLFAKAIRVIIGDELRNGKSVQEALLLGGLFLQRESMLRVPVDTGNLRASAFTRIER